MSDWQARAESFDERAQQYEDVRPSYPEEAIQAIVDFDNLNEGNIINLINRAGFGVGVGEWRPEKGGEYGRFMVDTSVPVKVENYGG